jgi:L-ascorbate metabolism protein UlaG (beta-lactamase superfamily)
MISRRELLLLLVVVAAPCPTAAAQPGPAVEYLANEGVLVTGGDIAVVIDGLFGEGLPEYPVVPPAIRDSLEAALGRFRDIDLVLVTHRHDDHFDPAAVARHMEANPEATLIAPGDAVAAFPPDRLEAYGERVQPLVPHWILTGSGGPGIVEAIGAGCTAAFHLERTPGESAARLAERVPSAAVLDQPGERLAGSC